MSEKDDLTAKQLGADGLSQYAVFLPAISGFYATFVGRQRATNDYVDPVRFPQGLTDMEQLNWLNSSKALLEPVFRRSCQPRLSQGRCQRVHGT